jgi:tetratricopeptide (TPR) repeat protein
MDMNKILALAIDEMNQRNFAQAKIILESLVGKDPENVDLLFCLGQCHCKMKDFKQAIHFFEKCVMLDPEYSKVYHSLRCVYNKAGILQKPAIDGQTIGESSHSLYLERAILFLADINQRCPNIPEVLISYAKVLEKKKEFTNAADCYRKIIQENKKPAITKLAKEALAKIRIKEIIEKVG